MSIVEAELPVVGMSCRGCAGAVTQALQAVRGVQAVNLELPSGLAKLAWDSGQVDLFGLVESVRRAGYDVATEIAEFQVVGMSCAGCVLSVTSALEDVPGVVQAGVDLKSGYVTVVYLRGGLEVEALLGAVRQAGYGIQGDASTPEPI